MNGKFNIVLIQEEEKAVKSNRTNKKPSLKRDGSYLLTPIYMLTQHLLVQYH
jgi:hypothetical protein